MSNSFKDQSRINWAPNIDRQVNNDEILIGAAQRIADATEKMAANYAELQNSRDWYKSRCEAMERRNEKLQRQVNAYKGMLKKKPKLQKQ